MHLEAEGARSRPPVVAAGCGFERPPRQANDRWRNPLQAVDRARPSARLRQRGLNAHVGLACAAPRTSSGRGSATPQAPGARVRLTGGGGPCDAGWRGWPDRRVWTCGAGSRDAWPAYGCWAGTVASRSPLRFGAPMRRPEPLQSIPSVDAPARAGQCTRRTGHRPAEGTVLPCSSHRRRSPSASGAALPPASKLR